TSVTRVQFPLGSLLFEARDFCSRPTVICLSCTAQSLRTGKSNSRWGRYCLKHETSAPGQRSSVFPVLRKASVHERAIPVGVAENLTRFRLLARRNRAGP